MAEPVIADDINAAAVRTDDDIAVWAVRHGEDLDVADAVFLTVAGSDPVTLDDADPAGGGHQHAAVRAFNNRADTVGKQTVLRAEHRQPAVVIAQKVRQVEIQRRS